jgi:hypothetical protein
MKKIALCCIMAACLSFAFYPIQLKAAKEKAATTAVHSKTTELQKAKTLLMRLHEIKAMDQGAILPGEKKNLKNEVISIRQQLEELDGGIYLSVGALILILILLIILL